MVIVDSKFNISFSGSLCDPWDFQVCTKLNIGSPSFISDDDSDSDQEEQEKKRKRRRRSSDRQTVMKEKWLKKHPLSIQLNVNCAGKKLDERIFAEFQHFQLEQYSV